MRNFPTPYADVNATLHWLLDRLQALLGERLVGLYLFGSMASGDFDPASSDIDFVVATSDELDAATVAELRAMHTELAASEGRWAERLNGAYLSLAALRRYDPACRQPYLSGNAGTPLRMTPLGADWILNRQVLRSEGITVYGPPSTALIDPIPQEELIGAVRESLQEWRGYLDKRDEMRARHYQAFAILTMCRAIYTLENGKFLSKPAAARWAQQSLDPRWAPLMQRAMQWRHDDTVDDAALPETIAFLRCAIECSENAVQQGVSRQLNSLGR